MNEQILILKFEGPLVFHVKLLEIIFYIFYFFSTGLRILIESVFIGYVA